MICASRVTLAGATFDWANWRKRMSPKLAFASSAFLAMGAEQPPEAFT